MLDLYKEALKDWEENHIDTRGGFCHYFRLKGYEYSEDCKDLHKYETVKGHIGYYKFSGSGSTPIGRRERINALKQAIKEL